MGFGRGPVARWAAYAAIAVAVFYTAFPVVWLVSNSFKTGLQVYRMPPVWIVTNPSLGNYVVNFVDRPYALYMLNSAIVGILTTFSRSRSGPRPAMRWRGSVIPERCASTSLSGSSPPV